MGECRLIRLYVNGVSPKCVRAVQTVKAVCEERLAGRYRLEVIDVYQQAPRARRDQVVVTPTLVEKTRGSVRRLAGNLWDRRRVLAALGLSAP